MKNWIFIALFVSTSVSAGVIAEVRTVTGFTPRACKVETVSVMDNGEVLFAECDEEPQLLTTLAPALVEKIQGLAQNLLPAQLVKADPDRPLCMDAPQTTYGAVNALRQMVAVGGVWGCAEMVHPTQSYPASGLTRILKGLKELSLHL